MLRTTILKDLILSFQTHPSGSKMHHQCCRMFQTLAVIVNDIQNECCPDYFYMAIYTFQELRILEGLAN